jgi:hypothetical protein
VAYTAYRGEGRFAAAGPDAQLRTLIALHSEALAVIARADASIGRFEELQGKRISVGKSGVLHAVTRDDLPDADRHGIVSHSAGLLNPNHYLAASIWYLFRHRAGWTTIAAVGKTIVSGSMIDRVAARLGRRVVEVPVGFKYFVDGLLNGSVAFAGEESAGASFVRRDGAVWATDKDGLIMGLLAVEMMARTGRDPGEQYAQLTHDLGESAYERIDAARDPRGEIGAGSPVGDGLPNPRARRRSDHRRAHDGARQRSIPRRRQGDDPARLVRGAPLGNRGRVQALRRELQGA